MSLSAEFWIGAAGNAVGGVVVALIFFVTGLLRERAHLASLRGQVDTAVQAELNTHSHVAEGAEKLSISDLAKRPLLAATALRLSPMFATFGVPLDFDSVLEVTRYVERVDELNDNLRYLKELVLGAGASTEFDEDEVDEREALHISIAAAYEYIEASAPRILGLFPTHQQAWTI